mmetsp:Transcript_22227/g.35679  ORF Transcript_22227/g.35679 Transcript_22227/m.35679 type:complete len:284 (+) Transcript_22227:5116-5967(+)
MLLPAGGHKHSDIASGHREASLLKIVRHGPIQENAKVWARLDRLHEAVHQRVGQCNGAEARPALGRETEGVGGHVGRNVELDLAVDGHLSNGLARDAQRVRVVDERILHAPLVIRLCAPVHPKDRARGVAIGLDVKGRGRVLGTKRRSHDHRVVRHVRAQALEGLAREELSDLVEILVKNHKLFVAAKNVGAGCHTKGGIATGAARVTTRHRVRDRDVEVLWRVDLREILETIVRSGCLGETHAGREFQLDRSENHLAVQIAALAFDSRTTGSGSGVKIAMAR